MGYIEKKELIEELKAAQTFSYDEICLLESLIEKDRIRENEALLNEAAIAKLEEDGLREKFLSFCKTKGIFPQWVENAQKGID